MKNNKPKKLYLIILPKKLGKFFVIAENEVIAKSTLLKMMQQTNHGFFRDRKIESIRLVAEELEYTHINEPNLKLPNKNLIIV